MEGAEKMIEFKNVSFSYKNKKVLSDFNIVINDSDRICFFGKSGVGKTTITRLILGLEKNYCGTVEVSADISAVFQEDRLLPYKTVYENLLMFSSDCSRIDYLLNTLGIPECKNKYPSELSGGMSRRVAIARALSVDADTYIFDEPFSSLDSFNTDKAIELINEITENKTIILVSHNKEDAQKMNCVIIPLEGD